MTNGADFSIWGAGWLPAGAVPARCRVAAHETRIEALCRALGRKSRLAVATLTHDGASGDGQRVTASIYQVTLGRPRRFADGGGYSVAGRLWVSITTKAASRSGPSR